MWSDNFGDVKNLRRINFRMNFQRKDYSQVAYEMIEIGIGHSNVSLTMWHAQLKPLDNIGKTEKRKRTQIHT